MASVEISAIYISKTIPKDKHKDILQKEFVNERVKIYDTYET